MSLKSFIKTVIRPYECGCEEFEITFGRTTVKEIIELENENKSLKAERDYMFWTMFQATERNLPVQFQERRSKKKEEWIDCAKSGPVWNWCDYVYRIKEE